jgi:signal transduction histidine kinase
VIAPAFRGPSIRAKLLAIVMLTAWVALIVAGIAFVAYDWVTFTRQRLSDLTTQAEILGSLSTAALTFDDAAAATEYLSALRARPGVVEAVMFDASGSVFATYSRAGEPPGAPPAVEPDGHRTRGDEVLLFRAITKDGERLGTLYIRAALGRRERLMRYVGIVLGVSVGSLAIAVLLLARLQVVIARPILEVADVAHGVIERQDYGRRVVKRSDDEIGVLVDAFNQMLGGIQQREASLQEANNALQIEIADHLAARKEVAALNESLERRVAERTAELEAANKELESFSYSVSHDLRAPLRSIDGFTMILQKEFREALGEEGQRHADRVRAATQRMGQLIDDLLQLSRTIRAEMMRKRVDLSELADTVAGELAAGSPGRDVAFAIAPGLVVYADPDLMRVVLENLLGNAFKFTGKVAHARIEVGSLQEAGGTTYFVRDNGAGFDMKYAGKLFGAFQRLHAVSEFEGTGVGLANVQRIVSRHGGRIWATGVVGEGATFYFTLGGV